MKKMTNILLLVAAALLAYQWRYKILNAFLGNESIRKVKSTFMCKSFRPLHNVKFVYSSKHS
ncbi:hypothetical protein BLX87_03945, partial [Bacillus sp. VT-16-64]